MRQTLAVAWLQLKLIVKSKPLIFSMVGLPLLFTFVFGSLGGGGSSGRGQAFPVAVVDEDQTFASRSLAASLAQEQNLSVRMTTRPEMDRLFVDKKIEAGVIIPAGFQEGIGAWTASEISLVAAPGGNAYLMVGPAVRRRVAQVAEDYRLARLAAAGGASEAQVQAAYDKVRQTRGELAVTVDETEVARNQAGTSNPRRNTGRGEIALGFTISFVMMMVFMASGAILRERTTGTWGRLLTAPASRWSLTAGYLAGFFLAGMFQFAVLVLASTVFFHMSWGPLAPLFALGAAFILCSVGIGLSVAGLVRSYEQQSALGILLVTATSMLGGVYWPLDYVSDFMRRLGYLTPQAWAMEGFRQVLLRGGGWSGLARPMTVLLAAAAVFLAAGVARVRYE